MPAWFRQGLSPHHTTLAMIGAKSGDRVAVLGAGQPDLVAELALVTGLNGETTVVANELGACARIEAAAGAAGALVVFVEGSAERLTFASGTQDIVVALNIGRADSRSLEALLRESFRVLRLGGRVVLMDGNRRTGFFGGGAKKAPRLESSVVLELLVTAGARGHRLLADVDGVAYYEARRG